MLLSNDENQSETEDENEQADIEEEENESSDDDSSRLDTNHEEEVDSDEGLSVILDLNLDDKILYFSTDLGKDYPSENKEVSDEEVGEISHDDSENKSGIWEDIYGRTRDAKGNVINQSNGKYIPPGLRGLLEDGQTADSAAVAKYITAFLLPIKIFFQRSQFF